MILDRLLWQSTDPEWTTFGGTRCGQSGKTILDYTSSRPASGSSNRYGSSATVSNGSYSSAGSLAGLGLAQNMLH